MAKNQHIVAVEIEHPDFTGFRRGDIFDFVRSENMIIGYRPNLEELDPRTNVRPDGKVTLQVIPYIVVRHRDKVLVYVRPAAGNEARLHSKMSIGLGGHVDLEDVAHAGSVADLKNTIDLAAAREVEEELGGMGMKFDIEWAGLIYRDDGPVDRVHLGCVGIIDITDEQRKSIGYTEEIGKIDFQPISEIAKLYDGYEIEAWTKAIIEEAA